MRATVIGSGGCLPTRERMGPGLCLTAGRDLLLFDCGPDCLHGLSRAGIPHQHIDTVLITHFHPDHTLGLPHLLFAERYQLQRRTKRLCLAGPGGFKKLLDAFRRIYPTWLEPRGFELEVLELPEGRRKFPDWTLEAARARHRPESLAYRVESGGRALVYTGDTAFSEPVIRLAREADLLVAEATFPDGIEVPGHLSPGRAGKMARQAGAARLLLTHLSPLCRQPEIVAQARAEISGEIIAASDGLSLDV